MRSRIAVITARADADEQREVLKGIAESAFLLDADVAVFSNIYNHWVNDDFLNFENAIYDFFEPKHFDGVIVTAEAFRDISVLKNVIEKIKKEKIPSVVIGGEIKGFKRVLSDDSNDLEKVAEHLITVHGFTDIDILAGFKHDPVSQKRVSGCKKAFEKYGIRFDLKKIHYGNFWNDSGEALAKRYLRGELPMPQAVICINDYMAYGFCDALTASGISIPQDISVIGCDYTGERLCHYPFLTTYKRDKQGMGAAAVNAVLAVDKTMENKEEFVFGNTCSCGTNDKHLREEIEAARIGQYHTVAGSVAQFSSRLTLCRTLAEYMSVLNEFFYLLHDPDDFYLCLDKEWSGLMYDGSKFLCCRITGKHAESIPETILRGDMLPGFSDKREKPMIFYFNPLFFQKRLFGYTAMSYEYPQVYDFSFRDWSKTAANALELLRLKNDIHYLTQCQQASSLYDSLTGFYNLSEFGRIVDEMKNCDCIYAVKISFMDDGRFFYGENFQSDIISTTARAIKRTCTEQDVCCRAYDDIFYILCGSENSIFSDKLKVILFNDIYEKYDERQILISIAASSECSLERLHEDIIQQSEKDTTKLFKRKTLQHYESLLDIRNTLWRSPHKTPRLSEASRKLCVSESYFRFVYKECFGVSFNRDCINARVFKACYLLCTTVMSIYAVAVKCGYKDEKYFARQFGQVTGISPMGYRKRFC